jgi:uncharacterized protein DUF4157
MRMAMPTSGRAGNVENKHDECSQCQGQRHVRRHTSGMGSSGGFPAPLSVATALSQPSKPLDRASRDFFEPRFGMDFSHVRVHDDGAAAASAEAINARAYTAGSHIVLASTADGHGTAGRWLLAHELAHVAQQAGEGGLVRRLCKNTQGPTPPADCAKPDVASTGDSTSWRLSIKIDVEADTPEEVDLGAGNVGHTSVLFTESNGNSYSYGFYSATPVTNPFRTTVPGKVVHPDHAHDPCIDYTESFVLTKAEYDKALKFAQAFCAASPSYDLQSFNCTTFAVRTVEQAGKTLPPVRGKVGSGIVSGVGDNPNTLLENLKDRDVPTRHLTSDTDIRAWVSTHDPLPKPGSSSPALSALPTAEKIRLLNRLLDGYVHDDDVAAFEKLCSAITTASERTTVQAALKDRESELNSSAQRTRIHAAL